MKNWLWSFVGALIIVFTFGTLSEGKANSKFKGMKSSSKMTEKKMGSNFSMNGSHGSHASHQHQSHGSHHTGAHHH